MTSANGHLHVFARRQNGMRDAWVATMTNIEVLKHATAPVRARLVGMGYQVAFCTTSHGYVRVEATNGKCVCIGFLREADLINQHATNYINAMMGLFEVESYMASRGLKTSIWAFSGARPARPQRAVKAVKVAHANLLRYESGKVRPI